ncbi:hypothetical protein HZA56_17130 [Candidatus Poribacteria bacterium]|nr:hypothetical protein [Candidatus Poribacteria bacterium]
MQFIGDNITRAFDVALSPFGAVSPLWGLLAVSIVTGVIMVLVFKHTSNQQAIRKTKDKISAHFLEVRLFKDDLALMLDSQIRILRCTLTYMKYSVAPMLVMIVPVILIMAQLGIRYDRRALKPGENAIVKVTCDDSVSIGDIPVSVETADGLRLETPLLHIPAQREVDFRVGAVTEGEHAVSVRFGDEQLKTPIIVSNKVQRVYPVRSRPGLMAAVLAPGQRPLPDSSKLKEIRIEFPSQELAVFGWRTNWLVIFFVASILAGYLLKGVFKVSL